MIEALWVLGLLVTMALSALLPADMLMLSGLLLALAGALGGGIAGFVYHLRLRTALLRQGPLPAAWWLFPVRQHQRLAHPDLGPVRPWFLAGAAGFMVAMGGCVLALVGLVRDWMGTG